MQDHCIRNEVTVRWDNISNSWSGGWFISKLLWKLLTLNENNSFKQSLVSIQMKQWMYLIAWIVISEYVITGEQVCFVETTVQLVKLFVYSWTEKTLGYWSYFPGTSHWLVSKFCHEEGAHKIGVWNGKHCVWIQEEMEGWQLLKLWDIS